MTKSQIKGWSLACLTALSLQTTPLAQTTPTLEQMLKGAENLVKERRLDEAVQSYKSIFGKHPKSALALYQIGWIYNEQNKYDTAARWLKQAADLNPNDPSVQVELAFALYKLKNIEGSAAAYQKASQLKPDLVSAWVGLGDLLFELKKDYKAAAEAYAKATSLGVEEAPVHYRLGWCYNELKRFKEAEPSLKKAVQLEDKAAAAWLEWGYSLLRTQRPEEAVQALTRATVLEPKQPLGHLYLGRAFIQMGQKDKAQAQVQRLKALDPTAAQQLQQEVKKLTGKTSSALPGGT